jgi:hypothetical protein
MMDQRRGVYCRDLPCSEFFHASDGGKVELQRIVELRNDHELATHGAVSISKVAANGFVNDGRSYRERLHARIQGDIAKKAVLA